jgi:hypothetical protein
VSEVVTEQNDPEKAAALVWWSTESAAHGTPWKVRHSDGSVGSFAAVRITGTVDFLLLKPEQSAELPDGPRGVAVLIDGTLVAGK